MWIYGPYLQDSYNIKERSKTHLVFLFAGYPLGFTFVALFVRIVNTVYAKSAHLTREIMKKNNLELSAESNFEFKENLSPTAIIYQIGELNNNSISHILDNNSFVLCL